MFNVMKDGNGNPYVEVAGVNTPNDWKDARVAFVKKGNDSLERPCIRLYNWAGPNQIGTGNVDVPIDALPALKQAIDYLMIYNSNSK